MRIPGYKVKGHKQCVQEGSISEHALATGPVGGYLLPKLNTFLAREGTQA